MASTTISSKKKSVQQRKPLIVERRSRTLKEFLNENSDSFSSSGFKSFPRQPCICNAHCFAKSVRLNSENTTRLLRSRSKAASTTISALQAVFKAVKKLQFTAAKPPSFLPRSLSQRLSRKYSGKQATEKKASDRELKITVTVKDIVRWASFRDLVEEKSRPLDFASSPHHCTTTTTTGSTSSTCSSSKSSSWCDSDFTSESLPSWSGTSEEYAENEVEVDKKHLPSVGKDCMQATTETESYTAADLKVEPLCDEKEQQSPVSVLDFKVGEDEEQFYSFTRSLANVERTRQNLLQKIQRFESLAKLETLDLEKWMPMEENTRYEEEVEEEEEEEEEKEEEPNELEKRATELLNHVRATSSVGMDKIKVEQLLLDFFSDELSASWRDHTKKDHDDELDWKMVSMAKAWISGEQNGFYECGKEHKIREANLRDMDSQKWSKFEEEKQELAMEVETQVLGCLVDEVLVDLFLH